MDILTLVKGLADGIGVAKNLHDGWEAISHRIPKHQLAEAEGPFLYPSYIDKATWSRLLQALIEIRTERIDIFSRAKLSQALSAIFEIESTINSFRLNQHANRSLETRARYLRNDRIIKRDKEIFSQIESLSVDYSYYSQYLFRESDRDDVSKIHGSRVFATPSYCAEVIAIESLNEKHNLEIEIDISRSSFLEASEYALNQKDRERSYIIGVDVSCTYILPSYRSEIAIVDMLGMLRNRLLTPFRNHTFDEGGKLILPFGEKASVFHYAKINNGLGGMATLLKNVDEISAYSSLMNVMSPESPNYAVAWSPYWQIICGMGRAELAISERLNDQPYSNWLLKLNALPGTVDKSDRIFGALIRTELALLNSDRARIRSLAEKVVSKYKIENVISEILKIGII